MKIKTFVIALMISALLVCPVLADDDLDVGFLTRLETTPEEFYRILKNSWSTKGWQILGGDHSTGTAKFYDSLMLMQMALNRDEIEEMILPDFVAEYLLKVNKDYTPSCIANSGTMSLCFGFMEDNRELLEKWNTALISMRNDYTLAGLEQKYIKNFPEDNTYGYIYGTGRKKNDTIRFERFSNAPAVRVAVTGDLPPVDFTDDSGLPAGYSMAVLAEIGRRLHVNIDVVNVSAGARTAALVSGRADAVFWYEVNRSLEFQPDVADSVLLSEPYLSWNTFMHIRKDED